MGVIYFFDTSALIEIARGRPDFKKYSMETGVTTKLNLVELYFVFIRERQQEKGKELFQQLLARCVDIPDGVLAKAAEMRFHFLSNGLSYIDCIGYILSRVTGLVFLTTDSKLELPGVEYVR